MSIYQCEHCGCRENTATGNYAFRRKVEWFDWTGMEDRKGKALCSACTPRNRPEGGVWEDFGHWHGRFPRLFLPKGMFITDRQGNLAHKETGDTEIYKYAIPNPLES